MTSPDATMVTGSPTGARLPRSGDVLGERWEIRASISTDAMYATYRGTDQETDQSVLVRVVGLGRLGERDAQRMAARLRLLVGMGGPVLSPIKDVDHEGARLYVIEKFPEGASFRSVLETRRAKGQLFAPAELVPLVAHLHGALSAITAPWFHGDVRAERIYVGPDRVLLTGGFAIAVMSGDVVRDTLASDVTLRRELAPEAAEGISGAAADRFGVALLVWEALVGVRPELPESGAPPPVATLGELGRVLSRYLSIDPASRPASLEGLLTALAQHAKVPVPRIAVESFSVDEPPTDIDQTELAMGPDPSLGTETVELLTTSSGDTPAAGFGHGGDTARHVPLGADGKPHVTSDRPAKRDLSGIDPALLAAAQASRGVSDSGTFDLADNELKALETDGTGSKKPEKNAEKKVSATSSADLDPRLVRAALGVSLEDSSDDVTDTLRGSSPPTPSSPPAKAVPPRTASSIPAPKRPMAKMAPKPKPAGTTQELDASELEMVAPTKPSRASAPVAANPVPASAAPTAPSPSPGPRPSSLDSAETFVSAKRFEPPTVAARPQLGSAAAPSALAPQPVPAPSPAMPPPSMSAPGPSPSARALTETPVVPQPLDRKIASIPPPARPMAAPTETALQGAPIRGASPISGNAIIALAVLIAALILGGAFWYRHVQENSAREHRIDERLREIRGD